MIKRFTPKKKLKQKKILLCSIVTKKENKAKFDKERENF